MTLSLVAAWVCLLAATLTLLKSFDAIWNMTAATNHAIRVGYLMICIGSFGEVLSILGGHRPGLWETLVVSGLGVLVIADRRCCTVLEQKRELHHGG